MKRLLGLLGSICLMLALAETSQAKEWRGILPLHSTRADVEKLLGPPQPPPKGWFYVMSKSFSMYFLDEGVVRIAYAEKEALNADECLKTVPAGTVVLITVTPTGAVIYGDKYAGDNLKLNNYLKASQLDIKDSKTFVGEMSEYKAYYNERDGILVSTYKGFVHAVCYLASAKDKHLCPSYYKHLKDFVEVRIEW